MTRNDSAPVLNTREEPPVQFLGTPTWVRASAATTSGAFGLIENLLPPGFASPYHRHHREDEAFYVLEGAMAFVCGETWMNAGPGTYVFGPRGIPHGFMVTGATPARLLLLCTPGGFEQFVLDLSTDPSGPPAPPDMPALMAVAARYEIEILGPLPPRP